MVLSSARFESWPTSAHGVSQNVAKVSPRRLKFFQNLPKAQVSLGLMGVLNLA